jgi:predicted nucleic acid-binding protein
VLGLETNYMNDKIFLDTNILVYAYNSDDPTKQKITVKLLREDFAEKEICTSVQVLNEFYSALSKHKIEHSEIEQYINEIINSVQIFPISVLISKKALDIRKKVPLFLVGFFSFGICLRKQ